MKLDLDSRIRCSDDTKVRLVDVVIEPRHRIVTHLVLCTLDHGAPHRLVPIDQLDHHAEHGLRLSPTASELAKFPEVNRSDFLDLGAVPIAEPGWAVGITDAVALPYFLPQLGVALSPDTAVTWDQVPAGEIEIRRHSVVLSTDGSEVGHVDGFVCTDGGDITHLVLQHGNVFGREDLAIPIRDVETLRTDRVTVSLTTDEIEALPGVSVHRWHHSR